MQEHQPMTLTAHKAALVVIDMQNSFCHPDGNCAKIGLPTEPLAGVVEPCAQLLSAARAAGIPVIHTQYVYREDYADGGMLVKLMPALAEGKTLIKGSWDAEFIEPLTPLPGEYVVEKNRPSAFYATGMEPILNGLGVDTLIVCGVTTNCCVESTVRDASHRDYNTFIVSDATAEVDEERYNVALKSMDMLFGKVVTVDEVLSAWSQAKAA